MPIILSNLSCELFTTRSPEIPSSSTGDSWVLPLVPSEVITNLENSIGRRSEPDYIRSLASQTVGLPTFRFIADRKTAASYPGLFDEWGIEAETINVKSLFSVSNLPLDSVSLMEIVVDREEIIAANSTITAIYSGHFGHLRETAPRYLNGQFELDLSRGSDGGWYVVEWRDIRLGSAYCWSDLKAEF